jgi:hypothetical protein
MDKATADLAYLMNFIGVWFPFTQENYPNGDLSTPEKARAFAVRHSQAHMSKSVGKIAAEAEEYDHGGVMDDEKLRVAATKMIVSALNFANALGMSAEEVTTRIPQVMETEA